MSDRLNETRERQTENGEDFIYTKSKQEYYEVLKQEFAKKYEASGYRPFSKTQYTYDIER